MLWVQHGHSRSCGRWTFHHGSFATMAGRCRDGWLNLDRSDEPGARTPASFGNHGVKAYEQLSIVCRLDVGSTARNLTRARPAAGPRTITGQRLAARPAGYLQERLAAHLRSC